MEQVSWDNVQAFLRRLEALGLRGFRLPTEAEWAWAARCGVATRWAGADRDEPVAVVDQASTEPVGSLLSSAAGALDFSGNVLEWQQDRWSGVPAAGVDADGPALGSDRVYRGGSGWGDFPQNARVAQRGIGAQSDRDDSLGVRLVRSTQ